MFAAGNGHTDCVRLLVKGEGPGIDSQDNVRNWKHEPSNFQVNKEFRCLLVVLMDALFQIEFKSCAFFIL